MIAPTALARTNAMLTGRRQRWKLRGAEAALSVVWLATAAGCVFHPTVPTAPPDEEPPAAAPSASEILPAASAAVEPAVEPAARPAPQTPPPDRPEVLVLFDGRVRAHVEVARQLEDMLSAAPYRVRMLPLEEAGALDPAASSAPLVAVHGEPRRYAVAVGFDAAELAATRLRVATVFCQVFNYASLLGRQEHAWGVASVPPLELQLLAWKRLDPTLSRVGLIVSEDHDDLVREALEAGKRTDVSVQFRHSSSDRETLYHFRRLAREVDGIWLLPDNRILSPSVIGELLGEALARRLQVAAVNARTLPRGVLLSASATPTDVAATASRVLAQVIEEDTAGLAQLTALSEAAVEVDLDMAGLLGLDASEASWSLSWGSVGLHGDEPRPGASKDAR